MIYNNKQSGFMREVKCRRCPRVVKDKKRGLRIENRRKLRRSTRVIASLCVALVLLGGLFGFGSALFKDAERNTVNLGYGSVSHEVATGEIFLPEKNYSAIDIFARLNWTFEHQTKWFSSMHSVVSTVVQQEVTTFKQYNDGILISADLTRSSIINDAKQFCYLKDRDLVIWRGAAGGPSSYDGINTQWSDGAPKQIMTISGENGFKARNGLPAYELSVYVIEENTVIGSSDVSVTDDGFFRVVCPKLLHSSQ